MPTEVDTQASFLMNLIPGAFSLCKVNGTFQAYIRTLGRNETFQYNRPRSEVAISGGPMPG